MPAEDVERFEAAVGEVLEEFGYARAFPCPRQERLESASRIRNLLSQDPFWIRNSKSDLADEAHAVRGGVSQSG
jgi:hypothetical protein